MTKSVWAIEAGEYSDYHVVGVFTSEENAEKIKALLNWRDYDDPQISEWPLDPGVAELNKGLVLFRILMLRNGDTEQCKQVELSSYNLRCTLDASSIWRRSTAPAYIGQNIPDVLNAVVWAKDAKHAVKIVNEKRAQMIANGEWE